ncbi:MAG TPA: MarR family transcriptional regulator, partial [Gryllotalpicola sp.]
TFRMSRAEDIAELVIAAHTLTRLAAIETRNEAPAAQWRALSVLQTEGPLRLGALATATRATQPGMTRLVGQLADLGLVARESDPADSRVTLVSITAAGAAALADWLVELRDALEPLFADLDDDDWKALSRVARILSARTNPVGATR